MKKTVLFPALTALLLIAGCSTPTVPSTPEQKPGKYAVQVIQIETPADSKKANKPTSGFSPNGVLPTPPSIEDLLKNRKSVVTEFPVVYAAVGETAITDQTDSITFPNNVKPAKIGCYVKATIQKAEKGTVSCDLDVFNQTLQGMEQTGAVPTPVLKQQSIKTHVTLALEDWMSMGGLIGETVKDMNTGKKTKTAMEKHLFVRILPPANTL